MLRSAIRYFVLFVIVAFNSIIADAQYVPHGFKYQTTIRDISGLVVSNQLINLRFSLYSGSITGTLQWQEIHTVHTNAYGAVDLIIGAGTSTGAGSAAAFDQINWSLNAFYLKVGVDLTGGNNFTDLGNTQLFSVPYAFYSLNTNSVSSLSLGSFHDVDLAGIAVGKLLKWNGSFWIPSIDVHSDTVLFSYNAKHSYKADTANYVYSSTNADTVLFSYKTDTSNFSFSSRNATTTSSSHYSDTATYALASAPIAWVRTGNTIGSAHQFIGTNDGQDLLFKTNNIERMRSTSNGNFLVGTSGNTASFNLTGNDGFLQIGTESSGALSSNGAGTRMLWYPNKVAYRAGMVTADQWDDANIGLYSFAVGYNVMAGDYSYASGNACAANGNHSLAMGRKSTTSSTSGSGVALGDSCNVTAIRCVALGRGNFCSVTTGVAIGTYNVASESRSLVMGVHSVVSGDCSVALGHYASTNGNTGSFVFADASSDSVTKTTAFHQFVVRASGGIIFYTDSAKTMGVTLAAGSGSWSNVSDVNKKENFKKVDGEEVLTKIENLKIRSWNYKSQSPAIRHIGPMAQDFYRVFNVGENNVSISGVDMDGVILAGIKALNFRVEKLESLKSVDDLKQKINELDNSVEMNKRIDVIEAKLSRKDNK